jgi:hypothetical protein
MTHAIKFMSDLSSQLYGISSERIDQLYTESVFFRGCYNQLRSRWPVIFRQRFVDRTPKPICQPGVFQEEMVGFEAQRHHPNYQWWHGSLLSWRTAVSVGILGLLCHYRSTVGYALPVPSWLHQYFGRVFMFQPISVCALVHAYKMIMSYTLRTMAIHKPFTYNLYGRFRTATRRLTIVSPKMIKNQHSHPLAASYRNSADVMINHLIVSNGFDPYSIQKSQLDIGNNLSGSLIHYWPIDTHSKECSDPIKNNHVFKLFNVDYYIDWKHYLWMAQPFAIFTFTPETPCGVDNETVWTVNESNFIEMSVNGGSKYVHQLWDYNISNFTSRYPGVSIDYAVESIRVQKHWSIVLITPINVHRNYTSDIVSGLQRIKFVHDVVSFDQAKRKAIIMYDVSKDHNMIICAPNAYSCAVIPATLQTLLRSRLLMSNVKIYELLPILTPVYGNDCRKEQAIIYGYFPLGDILMKPTAVGTRDADLKISYHKLDTENLSPVNKLSGTALAPPVLDSGWIPSRCKSNDEWSIAERVTKVKNSTPMPMDYYKYTKEFISLCVPIAGMCAPEELQTILVEQNRPSQVRSNDRVLKHLSDWNVLKNVTIKSFQKSEVYGAIKDPRNISTLPTEHCLLYSQYTRGITNILKPFEWYGFGKHPDIIARRVHHIASNSCNLVETDFSRFDGTHSSALYDLELALYLRAFPTIHHDQIRNLQSAMRNAKGITTYRVKYNPGGSRASGAADTSIGNTIDNAFISYVAYRESGLEKEAAFATLGIYGGDDGITPNIDVNIIHKVAQDFGLKLKALSRCSSAPTTFLGRKYPNPSAGPHHFVDVARQLPKLHIAPYAKADVQLALYNKAVGYIATDPNTPIISDWAKLILRTVKSVEAKEYQSWTYATMYVNGQLEPLIYAPSREQMMPVICQDLGVSAEHIINYCNRITQLTDIKDLTPIMDVETPQVPGIVVGNLLGLESKAQLDTKESKRSPEKMKAIVPVLVSKPIINQSIKELAKHTIYILVSIESSKATLLDRKSKKLIICNFKDIVSGYRRLQTGMLVIFYDKQVHVLETKLALKAIYYDHIKKKYRIPSRYDHDVSRFHRDQTNDNLKFLKNPHNVYHDLFSQVWYDSNQTTNGFEIAPI